MAFHTYVDISTSDSQKFFKGLNSHSQFLYSRLKRKTVIMTRGKKKHLSQKTLLPQISALWSTLSDSEKLHWTDCGSFTGMSGWRFFVSEMTLRINSGFSTLYYPVFEHQGKVGHLSISSPANQIMIAQYHPSSYYVKHKVKGKKGLYAPVLVTESMSFPLDIQLSYKSNLTAVLGSPYVKVYAEIYYSYQGIDRIDVCEIPIDAVHDWTFATSSYTPSRGYVKGYAIFIHIYGYRGDFYFDNLIIRHSATNWARDKYCNNIKETFSNQYYQIPSHWVALEIPDGSDYNSEYIDF